MEKDGDTEVCKEWEGLPPKFAREMFDQAMRAITDFVALSNETPSLRICGSLPSLILTALVDLRATLALKSPEATMLNLTDLENNVDILMQCLVRDTSNIKTDAVLDPAARAPFSSASLLEMLHGTETANQWQDVDSAKAKEDYQDAVLVTAYGRLCDVHLLQVEMKALPRHKRLAAVWRGAADMALEHERRAESDSVHTWLPATARN